MTKDQSAKIPNKHRPLWRSWLLCLVLPGCRSAPPPAPPPPAVSMAERAEQQALKISSQDQNWPAAARAWQLAADRYALLNDVPRQAMALHNLAQAERQTGQIPKAGENLEQASKLNEHIGNTNQWWRNQIALLQIEAESKQIDQLKSRFEKLLPLAAQIRDRSIKGLFLNELALWQMAQGDYAQAEKTLAEAAENFTAAKDAPGLAAIAANRAQLDEAQKNYSAALASWRVALTRFQALVDPEGITRALAGQGRNLLLANQELPVAEDLLRRAAHNYRTLQAHKQAQGTLELLIQCLIAEGKEKEAETARQELKKTGP